MFCIYGLPKSNVAFQLTVVACLFITQLFALCESTMAAQNFAGQGGMSLTTLGIPASAIPGKVWVDVGPVIVAISDDGKQAFAYCEAFPQWTAQDIDVQPDVKTEPRAGGISATVFHGHLCYAYSTKLGTWDTLKLPKGEVATPILNSDASVMVHSKTQGDFLYNSNWGKWFSAQEVKEGKVTEYLRTREPKTSVARNPSVTRFMRLRYCKATSAKKLIIALAEQFESWGSLTIVEDERLNQLILQGTESSILEVEEIVKQLDQPEEKSNEPIGGSAYGPGTGTSQTTPSRGYANATELSKQLNAVEHEARVLATSMRRKSQSTEEVKRQIKSLTDLVQRAFDLRQISERAELADFASRIETIRRSIESRERIAQQIVEYRVKELLHTKSKSVDPALSSSETPIKVNPTRAKPPAQSGLERSKKVEQHVTIRLDGGGLEKWQLHWQSISGTAKIVSNSGGSTIYTTLGSRIQFRVPQTPQLNGEAGIVDIRLFDFDPEKSANVLDVVEANTIPLDVDSGDFEVVRSGKLVTKVIYLAKDLSESLFGTVCVIELEAGVDPMVKAKELGTPIAIVYVSATGVLP